MCRAYSLIALRPSDPLFCICTDATNSGYIIKWRALFQNALSGIKKIIATMSMPSSEIMFSKRALHKYVHIYAYIHMRKALFENIIYELGSGIASPFFYMALVAFWKRGLHIHICMCMYIWCISWLLELYVLAKHLRSNQDRHRLVIACIHDGFIVLLAKLCCECQGLRFVVYVSV